ncbi:hypothetical protein Lesp02_85300 [Lentzea sp. NBRC 105346]|uniref:hypothetical protein n=1 Tax=Lentzea sp. NBRC 105346 TaxID=3032205 RepID=UPI0024A4A3C0|nr:hypothetical protein [Lentzea sp. NBRC 105346]GLZ36343.1 hypothetical protein Lesp02_85300 [Lentzea sp. NBRC 105346]
MSTTTDARAAGTEPTIAELLATWQQTAPPMTAPDHEVADWFEQSVTLLAPITHDPAHPQHAAACELAAENSHDALALRESARAKGETR